MTESPAPLSFDSAHLRDLRVYLLRKVLERYGSGHLRTSAVPGRSHALCASSSESGGDLLRTVCDVWSISFGELAQKAAVGQVVVSHYVMGTVPMSWEQTKAVSNALHSMIEERRSQPADPDR